MKTIHPGHLEHRFCIFGCQILCIPFLAIMPLQAYASELTKDSGLPKIEIHHSYVFFICIVLRGPLQRIHLFLFQRFP